MSSPATQEPGPAKPDRKPDPGPAPVGPAVHPTHQQPAETPTDPGKAPPGPAVEHGGR
jgi:hypothetical protein